MPTYIDVEDVAIIFETSYYKSTLSGPEVARILRIRFGQQDKKPNVNARNGKSSGFIQDGLPED